MMEKGKLELSILIGALLVGLLSMCILSTAIASRAAEGTQAVEYSKLMPFIPKAPSGWEADEPQGFSFTHEEGTWSMATSDYTKAGAEDVTANVVIYDYASYITGWTGAWRNFYAYESTEGYAKTATIKGYPGWEVYDKNTEDYNLFVGLNDRFLVFVGTNSDKDTLYKFADAIDYRGIAALGPGPAAQPTTQPTAGTDGTPTEAEEEDSETPGFELIVAVLGILAAVTLLVRRRG